MNDLGRKPSEDTKVILPQNRPFIQLGVFMTFSHDSVALKSDALLYLHEDTLPYLPVDW